MKRKTTAIIAILIAIILIISTCKTILATTSEEYKQQAEEAIQELESVEGEIDTALQEIEDLNTSIDSIQEEISSLSDQLITLNESISEKQEELDEKEEVLENRLVSAYMNGTYTYFDAILSGGILNFISNYEAIKQVAEYDSNLISEVQEAKQVLEDEKNELETLKSEKEQKCNELNNLKTEKEEKVSQLTEEQKSIEEQIEAYNNQMKLLEAKEKALSSSGGDSTYSGTFTWPVPSSYTISSNYGYRIHPIYGTYKLHAGLDISAEYGADIVAGADGTVILSSFGYNGGYGNYVIINHGNGVTTRYAHCSDLYVNVGDTVTAGQVIAAVGSTGSSTGNHCHFEVRINGTSKDPLNYL